MLWWTMSAVATSFMRDLVTLGRLDVQRDVALAALAPEVRGGGHAHAVAGHGLDLDDVGPEVADDHRPERPGEVLAEVDQPDAFERVHQAPPLPFVTEAAPFATEGS